MGNKPDLGRYCNVLGSIDCNSDYDSHVRRVIKTTDSEERNLEKIPEFRVLIDGAEEHVPVVFSGRLRSGKEKAVYSGCRGGTSYSALPERLYNLSLYR